MSDMKRFFIIFFSSMLTIVIMNYFFPPKHSEGNIKSGDTLTTLQEEGIGESIDRSFSLVTTKSEGEISKRPCFENAFGKVIFDTHTATPISYLYEYSDEISKKKISVFSIDSENDSPFAFPLFITLNKEGYTDYKFEDKSYENGDKEFIFTKVINGGILEKKFLCRSDSPSMACTVSFFAKKDGEKRKICIFTPALSLKEDKQNGFFVYKQKGISELSCNEENFLLQAIASPRIIGSQSNFFVQAIVVKSNGIPFFRSFFMRSNAEQYILCHEVVIGDNEKVSFDWYYGPKISSVIASFDKRLSSVMGYGWLHGITDIFFQILLYINKLVNNIGFSILLFALFLRLLLFPLLYASKNSIKRREEFSKKYKYLQNKYADDPSRRLAEQNALLKEFGMIPGGLGCLPVIFQIPIMVALQRLLKNSIFLYNVPFTGWIHDISMPDPYYILPMLFALLMYLQIVRTMHEPMKRIAMFFGAIILFFVFYKFPAGVLLFMTASSLVAYIQTMIIGF